MRSLYLVSLRSKPIHIFSRRTDAETFIRKAEAKRAPIRDAQHHQYILEKSQQSEVEKPGLNGKENWHIRGSPPLRHELWSIITCLTSN